jgi:hypothetical protein
MVQKEKRPASPKAHAMWSESTTTRNDKNNFFLHKTLFFYLSCKSLLVFWQTNWWIRCKGMYPPNFLPKNACRIHNRCRRCCGANVPLTQCHSPSPAVWVGHGIGPLDDLWYKAQNIYLAIGGHYAGVHVQGATAGVTSSTQIYNARLSISIGSNGQRTRA